MAEAWDSFGPSIRVAINEVYNGTYIEYKESVGQAFSSLNTEVLDIAFNNKPQSYRVAEISSKLLWMEPKPNTIASYQFRIPTNHIKTLWMNWIQLMSEKTRARWQRLWDYNVLFRTALGDCYEGTVHLDLRWRYDECLWKIWLPNQDAPINRSSSEVSLPDAWGTVSQLPKPVTFLEICPKGDKIARANLMKAIKTATHPIYLKPDYRNFPTFDGIVVDKEAVYLLQMTISPQHPSSTAGYLEVFNILPADLSCKGHEGKWSVVFIGESHRSGCSLVSNFRHDVGVGPLRNLLDKGFVGYIKRKRD